MKRSMKIFCKDTLAVLLLAFSSVAMGALVDGNNNPATDATLLGDIDVSKGTLGDMKMAAAPDYSAVSNAAMEALSMANSTNVIKDVVTNTVVIGYGEWKYSGDADPDINYSITTTQGEGNFIYTLWNSTSAAQLATYSTNTMNATYLPFSVSGGTVVASRSEIRRNVNGLAMYADVKALEDKIDAMDTSYIRTTGITNENQTVQYVYTDENTTQIEILAPKSGMTKDWIVYVVSATNVALKLPPANYWVSSESSTNEIPALTPTALYFSQVNDDTFSFGRKEFMPITVNSAATLLMKAIQEKAKKRRGIFRR